MTVNSPDTPEVSGQDGNNTPGNTNDCPTDGTTAVPLPANGVVFVENATPAETKAWANPFDGPIVNTVTNVTSNPANPAAGAANVQLKATVTSASNQIPAGATVTFSHATCRTTSGSPAQCTAWNGSTNIGGALLIRFIDTGDAADDTTYGHRDMYDLRIGQSRRHLLCFLQRRDVHLGFVGECRADQQLQPVDDIWP